MGTTPPRFPPFALTVDLAVFTVRDDALCILLVRRGEHPHRGRWALPGGHVRHGQESAEGAAYRELLVQPAEGNPASPGLRGGRPAERYRRGTANRIMPAFYRPSPPKR